MKTAFAILLAVTGLANAAQSGDWQHLVLVPIVYIALVAYL